MPQWLLAILGRVAEAALATGEKLGNAIKAVRKRAATSIFGKDIGYDAARNIVRRAATRKRAADILKESDGLPKGFRYPKCNEYQTGEGKYFATVFVNVINENTKLKHRIRIPVSFNDKLSATEIIDLALGYIENVTRNDRHQFDTNQDFKTGDYVDHNSAQLSSVCESE